MDEGSESTGGVVSGGVVVVVPVVSVGVVSVVVASVVAVVSVEVVSVEVVSVVVVSVTSSARPVATPAVASPSRSAIAATLSAATAQPRRRGTRAAAAVRARAEMVERRGLGGRLWAATPRGQHDSRREATAQAGGWGRPRSGCSPDAPSTISRAPEVPVGEPRRYACRQSEG
jgi:hypothetical protein